MTTECVSSKTRMKAFLYIHRDGGLTAEDRDEITIKFQANFKETVEEATSTEECRQHKLHIYHDGDLVWPPYDVYTPPSGVVSCNDPVLPPVVIGSESGHTNPGIEMLWGNTGDCEEEPEPIVDITGTIGYVLEHYHWHGSCLVDSSVRGVGSATHNVEVEANYNYAVYVSGGHYGPGGSSLVVDFESGNLPISQFNNADFSAQINNPKPPYANGWDGAEAPAKDSPSSRNLYFHTYEDNIKVSNGAAALFGEAAVEDDLIKGDLKTDLINAGIINSDVQLLCNKWLRVRVILNRNLGTRAIANDCNCFCCEEEGGSN